MRRAYKGRTDAMVKSSEGEQGFWPSYADMMSAVALILFFLMLLAYIQNMITGNSLRDTQRVLESTQEKLSSTTELLSSTQMELVNTEEALDATRLKVENAESRLNQANQDLDLAQQTLAQKEADIAEQDRLLADQKARLSSQESLIGEQEEYLAAANEEILAMRNQMQTIAVLRLSILEQIRDSVIGVMGDASKVSISDNGNIVLNEGVFFDVGSAAIKAEGVPTLNQLTEVFEKFLSDPNNVRYVDTIMISGHTDSTGDDNSNLLLSTDRANAVLVYLLDNGGGRLQPFSSYFCAAGYGETRPVADNDTDTGRAQNRRIEISIILRDDSILDIVNDYLKIDLPSSVQDAG